MTRLYLTACIAATVLSPRCTAQTSAPPDATPPIMTLDDAVAYALAHQPDIATAVAQEQSARGNLRAEQAGLRPSVNVTVSQSRLQTKLPGQTVVGNDAVTEVSASQLLYDLGRTSNTVAAARAQRNAAQATTFQTQLDVSSSVSAAYFTLLENQKLVAANADTVKDRNAQVDAAQARLDAGTASRFDVLQAQTAAAQSRQQLVQAQGDERRALAALNTAMGRSADLPLAVADPLEPQIETSPTAVKTAITNRPDVEAARQQVEAARRSLAAQHAGNAPTLAATGGLGAADTSFPATNLAWSLGVSVSWNVFDSGRNSGLTEVARAAVASAEADLRRTELNVTQQVTNAQIDVENAREQLNESTVAVSQATEARDVATGRYQAGVGTELDVQDAETQLLTARTNQINARYALANATENYQLSIGRLTRGRR